MPPEKADVVRKKRKVFAINLKAARIEAGLTQEDVGKITSLTRTFISRVETAKSSVSLDHAQVLAEAVHQPLCKLLTPRE